MTQHRLHARERMVHALVGARAEDRGDMVASLIHRRRFDPHFGDTAGQSLGILPQLPPDAIDDGCRIERPGMQPHSLAALAPVSGQLDPQLGADQIEGAEPGDERVGRHPHAERHLVGDLERGLEPDLAVQLGRRHARFDGARIATRRQRVQTDAALAEPLAHAVCLHRGELPEGLHAEPREESGELGVFERGDGQRRKETCGSSVRYEEHGFGRGRPDARRLLGRERTVGDARPHAFEPEIVECAEQHVRRLGLAPVVPRGATGAQGAEAWSHDLHPGRAILDAGDDRREDAVIAHRVGRDHDQARAAGLRVTAALPAPHAFCPGRRGACDDGVRGHHGDRQRGVQRHAAGGIAGQRRDRPVRKPQHEAADRRIRAHVSPPPRAARRGRQPGNASARERRPRREAARARDAARACDGWSPSR
jgi:hypothetical protein